MTIRHVLLDADGVLQDLPGGWYAAMEPYLGDRAADFLHETWQEERPMLAGDGDYLPVLAAGLARYGVTTPVEEVYRAVWHRIEVLPSSRALVHGLRAQGLGVHLASNQEANRSAYMRTTLGYDDLFDVCCWSHDLGVAKPDPRFFAEALRRIGAPAGEVLFVDDSAANVAGAREAGLRAECWHFSEGDPLLLELFAAHGITLPAD